MGDAEEQKAYLLFLENRTYRYLQHLAKALSLPSNYKKVYLIELIYAKKYRTEEIVKTIIQRVRIERLLAAKNRMRRNRRKRFTMPPRTKSPAISATPKRQRVYVPFSSDLKTVMRNTTRRSLLDVIKQNTLPRASDRVLRSFSLRQSDNSNYNRSCLINNSECNKVQNALNTKAVVKVNIPTGNFYKYYMNTECVVKKHRPAILNSTCNETRKPLILRQRLQDVGVQSNITAARRQRTISGIYPLPALTNCPQPVQTPEGASMRNYDGSRTKLNAVIQKCNTNYKQKITYCNTEVNIQDLIDSIDGNIENEDMQSHRTVENSEPTPSPSILNSHEQYTEPAISYSYHIDRMRYQMMYDRSSQYTDEPVLPKINEVFPNINCMQNIAQPLYVQVSSEDELSRNYPLFADNCNTELLESLYNFKNQMLTNVPLLQIATTDNTRSTYSTSTVTTAKVHHSASHGNDYYDYNPFELDNRYTNDPRLYEFFRYSQQQRNSALNRSSSSTETYHERSTPATVPEMLEDAVELISQDGDYMEQIGMDVRVLCVLCEWAGPNILLENHILKEHGMSVVECEAGVGVSWSLAALWRACACVLRRATALYVLRARYSDPDRLSAQLAVSTVMSVVECEAGVGVSWSLAALWRACACVLCRATALYVLRARYSDPDRLSAQLAVSTVMSVVECEAGVGVSWSLAALWRACACVLCRATALYVLRARYSDPDRLSAQLAVSTVMSVVECEAGVGVSWSLAALWRACACVLCRATALYVLRARYSDPDRLSAQLAVSTVMSVVECEAGVGVSWSLAALWRACACVLCRATALYVLRARYSDPDRLSAQLAVSTVMSVVECEAGVGVSWSLAALWRACACVLCRATALYVLRARYSDPDRLSAQLAVSTVMSVVECEAGVGVSWSLAALWRACACVLCRATALYVLRARYSDPDRLSAQLAVSTVMSVVECEAGVGVSWSLAALWRACACVLCRATALYVLRARYSDPDRLSAQLAVSTVMSVVECEAGVGVSWSLAALWRACACVLCRATALYVLRARYSDPDRLSAQLAVSTVMSVVECEAGVGVSWSLAALWRACACVLCRATALYVLRARYSDPDRLSAQLAVSTVMSVVECEAGVGVSWSLAALWRACACVLCRATALYVLRARYSDPDRLSAQLAVSTVMSVVECEAGVGVSWSLAALWRACACVLCRATALYVLRARYSDPDRLSAQLAVSTSDSTHKV